MTEYILEQNQLLSQSILWQLQQNYYQKHGINAWREGIVPHYITSNPFIADAYAKVVIGFLRDCRALNLPPEQPVTLVEIGAGSGRFSFHFLQALLRLYRGSTVESVPIRYVMTDIATPLIAYWETHPSLAPLVAEGLLDFARFDAGRDDSLTLRQTGITLTPASPGGPMVVIANYVFDSIPQDCFYIEGHRIYESLVTVTSQQEEKDLADPELITRVGIRYEHRPTIASYYPDRDQNHLLRTYQHQLERTTCLFPRAALECVRHFQQLSGNRLLLISSDKGYIRAEGLEGWAEQELTIHGSFSMMVNYHAIAQHIQHIGGEVLEMSRPHEHLNVSAFLIGPAGAHFCETAHAYRTAVDVFGPDEFFTFKEGIQQHYAAYTPQQLLAYLRLSRWDAALFMDLYPALQEKLTEATEPLKSAILETAQRVWENYYPIGETEDVPFQLGMLLYTIDHFAEALTFFQHSYALQGADPSTCYNLSLCYHQLGQLDEALKSIDETLDLDPAFEGGQKHWQDIQQALEKEQATE